MAGTGMTIGIIVERSSDFVMPSVKIASKDKVFEIDADKLPQATNLGLGDWVASRSNDFESVMQTKRIRLGSRIEHGKVQVFSYVAVPFGHCSIRDGFLLPDLAKVWSPQLGYAFSESDVMFGMREEILYEAWFEYRSDCREKEPIWELKVVGQPIIDPSKTILLKQTPWKLYSKKVEVGDTTFSAVLNADRKEWDRYYNGLVIALIDNPEPGVILYSRSYDRIVTTTEKKIHRSIYRQLQIGQIVKFRECNDPITNEKYSDIKEIVNTTRRDIRFEVKNDRRQSYQAIKVLTSIGIDDGLLDEGGETPVKVLCEYGVVSVNRDTFAKQMEGVCLERDDLVKARKENKELQVWIAFVPISMSWTISHIHDDWFTSKVPA